MKLPDKSERIDQVKQWFSKLKRWGNRVYVEEDTGWKWKLYDGGIFEWSLEFKLYTREQCYTITAHDRMSADGKPMRGYLGCVVTARYPRLGESWRRGNDLPDGSLTKKTWLAILHDILAYELEDPTPQQTAEVATLEVFSKALYGALEMFFGPPFGRSPEEENILNAKVTRYLTLVLEEVELEKLPEFLVSKDDFLRIAARERIEMVKAEV